MTKEDALDGKLLGAAQKEAKRILEEMRKTVEINKLPYHEALQKAEGLLLERQRNAPRATAVMHASPSQRDILREELRSILREEYTTAAKSKVRFIRYDNGQWYARSQHIDFPNPNADYCTLILVMYQLNIYDAVISYEKINTLIQQQGLRRIHDAAEVAKRINNLIRNLYRMRKRQNVIFPKMGPDGKLVIKVIPGKGLLFHNPEI